MSIRVFIDGGAGTTGLEIRERLAGRDDIDLLTLPEERRKDAAARAEALNDADLVILCLPDDAAREAVALIRNPAVKVIDASTAHRIDPAWTYGLAELASGQRDRIAGATRVSNPGCYPTGFLALVAPLVRAGLIPADWPLSVNAVSGYSGGGKAMIAAFEQEERPTAFQLYALSLGHKHLPEMRVHAGLTHAPIFAPAVANIYRGMLVEVPLPLHALPGQPGPAALRDTLEATYAGSPIVRLMPEEPRATLTIEQAGNSDRLDLFVFGDEPSGQVRLVAALDNLGKGAAGAAVQTLNLMCGLDETVGLRL